MNWGAVLKTNEANDHTTAGNFEGSMISLVFHRKDLCEARVKPKMSSNLADKPSSANVPPLGTQNLADEPTFSGRQTFFGRWIPQIHKIWKMNLLQPMDPLGSQNLADEPTFSGRQTFFGRWTPQIHKIWQTNLLLPMDHCY